ncbi:hypothetical protein RIR_jg32483.t1 [Rhizophagus irregularis DAOM 181602=DAOM 197198]|nr:hypothetical protein RIR_jg32483.t1 [Rhizophagus irregularis DAOM 181602=DAOM 197198]
MHLSFFYICVEISPCWNFRYDILCRTYCNQLFIGLKYPFLVYPYIVLDSNIYIIEGGLQQIYQVVVQIANFFVHGAPFQKKK